NMSFLSTLLGGNLKLGGGVGFNDSSTNTSSDTNTTQNLNTSNTGTVTKNLAPFQSLLTGPISSTIMQLMTNPTAFVAPFAAQARDQTNSTYGGLADSLRQQFLGTTGGGQSGK